MASISIRNLCKTYPNGTEAVKDVSLEVRDGEFIVIVGPSGCGKSSVLRMVAGLEEITGGDILINGERINDVAPKNRNISMVFQNYALFPHLDVYGNIAFGLKLRKTEKKELDRRVQAAAELLGIRHLLKQRLGQLSGGERQRVAMGRAIVREPAAFLMDEPLSNLDAKLRTQMRAELSRLHSQLRNTFLYVTHDQTEAMTMGERIVVMDQGVIQQIGTPEEIYQKPANRFVAGFIGTPPMNLFPLDGAVAGVRPEHIRICGQDTPGARAAVVELVEFLGSEKLIYLNTEGQRLIMKAPDRANAAVGQTVHICWEPAHQHLFPA